MILKVIPIIDYSMRGICKKAYPLHPKGCPNFGKRPDCPPGAPFWDKYINLELPTYAIINKFDFATHKTRMRGLHPNWSQRQVECCLYWQGTARKQLKIELSKFNIEHPKHEVFITPEAMGVNITETMKNAGIILEWPPNDFVYKIALAAVPIITNYKNLENEQLLIF